MLRYLAYGLRDFAAGPIREMTRFNWEFYVLLRGGLRPKGKGFEGEGFAKPPTLWLFPPEHLHGWESRRRIERVVFHFSSVPDVIREACVERGHLTMQLEPEDAEMVRRLGRSLAPHYRSPTPASLLLFDRALIDLSLLLLRGREFGGALPLETVAVERVERATEWYLSHLHERPTLDALAEVVHMSVAHLRRQFRLVHGKSPHEVLTDLRLDRAAQVLANTNDTLEAVSRRSGFNSASDLCRVFRRRFGVYPNEWRTQVAGKENATELARRQAARVDPAGAEKAERMRAAEEVAGEAAEPVKRVAKKSPKKAGTRRAGRGKGS
jgi:AraC family transcriptional regulator